MTRPGDREAISAISPARRLGYRLLGRRFDYVLHTRPAEWPIMAAHTALGYFLAVGLEGAARGERLGEGVLGLALWVLGLNAGTLAINSAFDRDEGDIGYLRSPPPPPPHLAAFGFGLMAAGQLVALVLPPAYALAYGVCFVLSLLYSVPPFRLKAVAGADWAINMWGFGTLTPYATWAATGRPIDTAGALVLLAFCPLFAALYPLTQLYQFDEDRRRGDRTLALRLGMRRSLVVAVSAVAIAFGLFLAAGVRAGWGASGADAPRWAGLALSLGAWLAVLVPWLARHEGMNPAQHERGMYRALGAWAVTDAAVLLAWGA
ncbi:MAG TPA: UbiA family prenyltransferase [Gemmatimonadales bacterium]|nr:UbiA family prenyltransferase [Gemmatimonadales bacterium]